MKIETIDVTALEWFDKVNGNSYFAGTVVVNYCKPDEVRINMGFQYGYGSHYEHIAMEELIKAEIIVDAESYKNGSTEGLRTYCRRTGIILRSTKHENCKRRELKDYE